MRICQKTYILYKQLNLEEHRNIVKSGAKKNPAQHPDITAQQILILELEMIKQGQNIISRALI